MVDSGPKTDAKNESKSEPVGTASDSTQQYEEESGELIPETELDKEILDSSPSIKTLVGDLQKSDFKIDAEDKKNEGPHGTNLSSKLKSALVNIRKAVSLYMLFLASRKKRIDKNISDGIKWYKQLTKVKKAGAIVWAIAFICVALYSARLLKGHILHESSGPYHFSMDDFAESNTTLEAKDKSEPLYDNIRVSPNTYLLPKIVVNIHSSASSSSNPMAAFEFFVDSISPDAILEVKDREPAVLDKAQRRIEEFTFDELQTVDGKKHLCQEVTNAINSVLTRGTIRRTLIKTIFLKP